MIFRQPLTLSQGLRLLCVKAFKAPSGPTGDFQVERSLPELHISHYTPICNGPSESFGNREKFRPSHLQYNYSISFIKCQDFFQLKKLNLPSFFQPVFIKRILERLFPVPFFSPTFKIFIKALKNQYPSCHIDKHIEHIFT